MTEQNAEMAKDFEGVGSLPSALPLSAEAAGAIHDAHKEYSALQTKIDDAVKAVMESFKAEGELLATKISGLWNAAADQLGIAEGDRDLYALSAPPGAQAHVVKTIELHAHLAEISMKRMMGEMAALRESPVEPVSPVADPSTQPASESPAGDVSGAVADDPGMATGYVQTHSPD